TLGGSEGESFWEEGDNFGVDEEGEGSSETMRRSFRTEMKNWNEMIHHHFHQGNHSTDEMRMDDLE
nr:hypothetical protein [Tanacetum cinerariifolium]